MYLLFGACVLVLELIGTGTLLKIGSHVGLRFLERCGEVESPYPTLKTKGGRNRALEQAGQDLSVFLG